MINSLDFYRRIMLSDFRQLLAYIGKNSCIKHFFSIFCYQYHMIFSVVNTMR